ERVAVTVERDRGELLLPVVKGIVGSWQEAPGWRRRAGGDRGRGQGSASGRGRCLADAREPAAEKKHDRGWGRRRMRYPAAEKLEIIRLVEQSPRPVRHTLAKLGIPRATFYRWYDRHSRGGPEALNDRALRPDRRRCTHVMAPVGRVLALQERDDLRRNFLEHRNLLSAQRVIDTDLRDAEIDHSPNHIGKDLG